MPRTSAYKDIEEACQPVYASFDCSRFRMTLLSFSLPKLKLDEQITLTYHFSKVRRRTPLLQMLHRKGHTLQLQRHPRCHPATSHEESTGNLQARLVITEGKHHGRCRSLGQDDQVKGQLVRCCHGYPSSNAASLLWRLLIYTRCLDFRKQ